MYDDYKVSDDLKSMMNNERIVWSGRPKKSCFVLECIFNPMLIFAFIWFMFDFMFISQIFSSDLSELDSSVWMFVGFFALHLMPVWIYLGGVIFSFRKLAFSRGLGSVAHFQCSSLVQKCAFLKAGR